VSSVNVSSINSSRIYAMMTNATVAWNETDQYLPFHVVIDPAYGTLGGLLIISGIPVALLAGRIGGRR